MNRTYRIYLYNIHYILEFFFRKMYEHKLLLIYFPMYFPNWFVNIYFDEKVFLIRL